MKFIEVSIWSSTGQHRISRYSRRKKWFLNERYDKDLRKRLFNESQDMTFRRWITMSLIWRFVGNIAASSTFFIVLTIKRVIQINLGLKVKRRTRLSTEWSFLFNILMWLWAMLTAFYPSSHLLNILRKNADSEQNHDSPSTTHPSYWIHDVSIEILQVFAVAYTTL